MCFATLRPQRLRNCWLRVQIPPCPSLGRAKGLKLAVNCADWLLPFRYVLYTFYIDLLGYVAAFFTTVSPRSEIYRTVKNQGGQGPLFLLVRRIGNWLGFLVCVCHVHEHTATANSCGCYVCALRSAVAASSEIRQNKDNL
jgi:hypothetical protein